jgi:hypothetical protein
MDKWYQSHYCLEKHLEYYWAGALYWMMRWLSYLPSSIVPWTTPLQPFSSFGRKLLLVLFSLTISIDLLSPVTPSASHSQPLSLSEESSTTLPHHLLSQSSSLHPTTTATKTHSLLNPPLLGVITTIPITVLVLSFDNDHVILLEFLSEVPQPI